MEQRISGIPLSRVNGIPVLEPNEEQFNKGILYSTKYLMSIGAHTDGIAKVIPPSGWKARGNYDDVNAMKIPTLYAEDIRGQEGVYKSIGRKLQSTTVESYRKMTTAKEYKAPKVDRNDQMDDIFWKSLDKKEDSLYSPLYGKEIHMSLFDKNVKVWNLGNLNSPLKLMKEAGISNDGITSSYTYLGMYATTFPWHTEDHDLLSINFQHFGKPKIWYAISPVHAQLLENLAAKFYPGPSKECDNFMRHKSCLISPAILEKNNIPFKRVMQEPGEFIITFPRGYHCGYNQGYNCNEAVNFSVVDWIDYGLQSKRCVCNNNRQDLPATVYLKLQPERYNAYRKGELKVKLDYSARPPAPREPYINWDKKLKETLDNVNQGRSNRGLSSMDLKSFLMDTTEIGSSKSFPERTPLGKKTCDTNIPETWNRLKKRHQSEKYGLKTGIPFKKRDPVSFKNEKEVHSRQGRIFPYCSVCRMFTTSYQLRVFYGGVDDVQQIAVAESGLNRSPVLVSEYVFECPKKDPCAIAQIEQDPSGAEPKSPLLECSSCNVVVHASCYGVSDAEVNVLDTNREEEWFCDRCTHEKMNEMEHGDNSNSEQLEEKVAVVCCLCKRYTGALKKVENLHSTWVHVTCALASSHVVRFGDTKTRSGITITERLEKEIIEPCTYCTDKKKKDQTAVVSLEGKQIGSSGVPIKCTTTTCKATFHLTCALENGLLIREGVWPDPLDVYCRACTGPYINRHERKGKFANVKVGDTVEMRSSTKGGSGKVGEVLSITKESRHQVYVAGVPDSVYVKQEELVEHDWDSYPKRGSDIMIKRPTDEQCRPGAYVDFTIETFYEVEGSESKLKSDGIVKKVKTGRPSAASPQKKKKKMSKQ